MFAKWNDYSPQMIEKADSSSLTLAMVAVIGQAPGRVEHGGSARPAAKMLIGLGWIHPPQGLIATCIDRGQKTRPATIYALLMKTKTKHGTAKRPISELGPDELHRSCDLDDLEFETTSDLAPLEGHFAQDRAIDALRFGLEIRHDGYNIFLLGSTGAGKRGLIDTFLNGHARPLAEISDWCYVNNFASPHKPSVLKLPPGTGKALKADMAHCVEDLLVSIPAAFQSDEYQTRLQEMGEELSEREQKAFQELADKARKQEIALVQTPNGYTLAPLKDEKLISPKDFEALPEEEKKQKLSRIDALKDELKVVIRQLPSWVKEGRDKVKELNREYSRLAIEQLFKDLDKRYRHLPEVGQFLAAVKNHVIENIDDFRQQQQPGPMGDVLKHDAPDFAEYSVNTLVDNDGLEGAPIVYEDNPSFINIVGRVEHTSQYGTLLTDFTQIKPGALHKANGGYLVIEGLKILTNPFAWETLKRILRAGEVRIQSLERMFSFSGTTQLEPEPIPLAIKVVLTGDRYIYYLLKQFDPEFDQLFKIAADMSEEVTWTPENTRLYARLIAGAQRRSELQPFDRQGVARVIEHCARRMDDNQKLSLHLGQLDNLLCESDHYAKARGSTVIGRADVEQAIDSGIHRLDHFKERSHESILRGIRFVDTEGRKVAQINGLSVYMLGDYAFGTPTRITATARLGDGQVIDIEREVKLGGRIHSKGVLIISSFLASRYARDRPLPLSASLVFEQSYGGVEGDSASAAELIVLLSALADIPLRQDLAITGSINQHGQIQAIGGVNEKIEGFYDICAARGLAGKQGVVIPRANAEHLMLRENVVAAVQVGNFHVYTVETIDDAVELLAGAPAGKPDKRGRYPTGSVNGRVAARVKELNALGRRFSGRGKMPARSDG